MLIKSARQHNTGFANRCVSALQFGPCGAKRGFWSEVQLPVQVFITTFALNLFILVMLIDNILRCKEDTWSVFFTISSHTWRSYLKPCFCYQKLNINPIIKNKIPKVYISEQCASVSLSSEEKDVRKSWVSVYLCFDFDIFICRWCTVYLLLSRFNRCCFIILF